MNQVKKTGAIDQFRLVAAFLVIVNHTSPFLSFSEDADFVLTRIIARIAVPFFLMVSGYFLYEYIEKGDKFQIIHFCKKIVVLYVVSIVLFLPLNLYAGHYKIDNWLPQLLKDIFFNGTFYHLWYLPGLLLGILLVFWLRRMIGFNAMVIAAFVLYIIGLFGDSYYGLAVLIPLAKDFYDVIFLIFDYTRNGIFMVPIFLVLGMVINRKKDKYSLVGNMIGLVVSLAFLLGEGLYLNFHAYQRHDSMYFMLIPTMVFLFQCLLQLKGKSSKDIRSFSTIIYIIHPWAIVMVRFAAKLLHVEKHLIQHSLVHFLAVSFLSFVGASLIIVVWKKAMKVNPSPTSRAWVEVDLKALKENVKEIRRILPEKTALMAVVKANGYGHGAVKVAKTLYKEGINSFAVASLEEGIVLRKGGIKGDILILGYTEPREGVLIKKYGLTQTVVDLDHALNLNKLGMKIKVHLKIDTGMHRLGLNSTQLLEITKVYECENLIIEGFFTHLAASDSLQLEKMSFSKKQIAHFNEAMSWLESHGYRTGKRHIQASYGIVNFPDLQYDYARAGIILYGVLSKNDKVCANIHLQPVLSLKAKIASIKQVKLGDCISYGMSYKAKESMKIAIVTIGYADGVPRNITNGCVLIHGQRVPIIGRICMDQLMIDITDIEGVKESDIVTIIGRDGNEQITCEDFAEKCGTITNEILSRLGSRLAYIYKL